VEQPLRLGEPALGEVGRALLRPASSADTEAELRVVHKVHSPSRHCSAGSVVSRPDERSHLKI